MAKKTASKKRGGKKVEVAAKTTVVPPEKAEVALVEPSAKPHFFAREDDTTESWCRKVIGLQDERGAMPAKVRLEVRQTRHEKYSKHIEIQIGGQSPMQLSQQLEDEAGGSGYRDVRASAFMPNQRLPFTTFVIPSDEFDTLEDDGPEDGAGLSGAVVRQAVRHSEVMMQSMMAMQAGVMRHLSAQNKDLATSAERLAAERLELIELVRQVKLEGLDEREREARSGALIGVGKTLASAVAYRLTDGKGEPSAREDVMSAMIQGFGESLTEQQQTALRELLKPEQIVTLAELFRDPKGHAEAVAKELAKNGPPNK